MTRLTSCTELVFSSGGPLGSETGVTLVTLGPDGRVMEDTYGVELPATVNTLHHPGTREREREMRLVLRLFSHNSRLIVNVVVLLLLEHRLGNLGGVHGVVAHGNRIPRQLGETLLAVNVPKTEQTCFRV